MTHKISIFIYLAVHTLFVSQAAHAELALETIAVNGVERTYFIHQPDDLSNTAPVPLVLALHGGGRGDGEKLASYLHLNSLADRHRFIVIYPNGIHAHWNDGRGYTSRGKSDPSIDDVGFISTLIDQQIKSNHVDAAKVYVAGVSNGGMMTYRLGCEITEKVTAIAPVIANIPANIIEDCQPSAPLPVLVINGTEDPLVPWDGGEVRFFRKRMGIVLSTEKSVKFWLNRNHCFPEPAVVSLPDLDPDDRSTVSVYRYSNPDQNCDVQLYTIYGGGHNIPGSKARDMPLVLGQKNNDINTSEVIWNFFSRHSR